MKAFNLILLVGFTLVLLWATVSLPERGDPDAPAQQELNPAGDVVAGSYFIQNAYTDAATPNFVTVILADYRSIDTLGEVIVVFTAAIACFLILRRKNG